MTDCLFSRNILSRPKVEKKWAQSKSIENIGSKGEKLELSLEAQRNKEISKKLLQEILNTKQSSRES